MNAQSNPIITQLAGIDEIKPEVRIYTIIHPVNLKKYSRKDCIHRIVVLFCAPYNSTL